MSLLPLFLLAISSNDERADARVYQCDASEVEIVTVVPPDREGLGIWLPPAGGASYRVLPTIAFEPGLARFGDDTWRALVTEGTLELKGPEDFGPCRYDHRRSIWESAKLSGVSFRAVGQEPGWILELRDGDRMDFSFDYGQRRIEVPAPEPESDAEARLSRFESWPILVEIHGRPCTDTMSGEAFAATVVIQLADRTFNGCGRALY